jgi:aspartate/glutamate racemase
VKTIGIVGGVAWPSSIVYYRTINERVARRLGGLHCASLVLAQTDFAEVERQQREGRWDLVGDLLAAQGNKLKAAGADFSCWPATPSTRPATVSKRRSICRSSTSSTQPRARSWRMAFRPWGCSAAATP